MTTYLSPTGDQAATWLANDLCHVCGGVQTRTGACRCRYCDSCSRYWLADKLEDGDDGDPKRELCFECIAVNAYPEMYSALLQAVSALRVASIDGRSLAGSQVVKNCEAAIVLAEKR